ncbi:phage tail protein [Gluconobacter cerinus]|uniref:glycine zipper domain-containing protein n=1 Tax=Gluconobacter cerinus TaxID=38307 RepID=UPI001B8B8E75|nr:glycine zipper domain-containing protein [Gluconobacter cerinus]MBS1020518.1 phage tail protein [Gluconobacter cerinus]
MVSITQVNTIRNQIISEDLTADGVASASRNLDAMQAKGDDVAEAMTGMGDAARSATTAVADAADKAATVLDRTAQKGVSSLTSLRRELSSLRAEEKALQVSLDQGLSSGTDTSDTTSRLSEVQAAMKATRQNIADLTREQKTAADAQAAWNGTLGEGNAATIGMRDALLSFDQTQKGVSSGLQAGMTGSLKTFLQMSSAAGDEVAKLTLQLQKEEDRLQQMRAQAASAVADGLSQTDAQAGVSTQQAKVDTTSQRLSEARRIRDALDQEAEGHKNNANAAKLETYQLTILMDEAHKFLDMVMSGGNPLKAAFYEVPNAVGVLGGFGKAVDLAGGAMTVSLAGGALAAGAAIYKMGSMAEEEQSRLAKLSTQLKATRDDAQHMAGAITSASESLKAMPGWDESSARTAASTIGSTYNFSGSSTDISTLAGIARDAGSLFGSLEDGLKAVQTAMVDPTAEIEALYKQHLPGVDAALVEQVKTLQASGQQGEAYALVISKIRDASKDAYDQGLTPFQRSLENLEKAATPVTHAISDLVTGMGARLLEWLTDLINLIPTTSKVSTDGLAGSTVLDNYAGGNHHYGLGQVDPRYASGYDISTPQGNIDAALKIFMQANTRAGGNWDNTLAYYSGNKVGSAGQKSYNSAVYGYDINTLPSDTSSLIDTESSRLGLSSRLVNLFKGVIGHESGGHQYVDHAGASAGSAEAVQHATSAGVIDNGRSIAAGASDAAGGYSASSWSEQRAGIQAYIEAQQKLLAQQDVGSQKWKETQESITAAKVALANTLSPQEKITQGLTDSLDPLKAQTGYWRSMAEVVAQFDQTTRGTGTDQQALSAAMTAKQQQLAAAYEDGTVSAERQAKSQAAIADAAGGSAVALQHATNYQQAYTDAQNDFSETSPEFAAAVAKRTAALDANTAAQMKAQQLQQNAGLSDNLQMIEAQTASIGQNAQARQVNLAIMQAELEMHRKYGEVLPQVAQDYVDLTGQIARASAEYQQQQDALNELTSDISSMADTLSSSFTQAFVNASNGGVTFKSAMQGVESQIVSLIAKLALINPLLNAIDGQSRNTLSSISSLLSGRSSSSSFGNEDLGADPFGGSGTSVSSFGNLAGEFGGGDVGSDIFEGAGTSASAFSSAGGSLGGSTSWLSSAMKTNLFGSASVGSLLGGVGGGFGLGSALSGIGGGTKSNGTIGSAVGAAAGAAAGSFIPVIGTMLGGLIGGGLGGLFGGMFGHKKNPYTIDQVMTTDGQLSLGKTWNQAQTDQITEQLKSDIASFNSVLSSAGVTIGGGDGGLLGTVRDDKNNKDKSLQSVSLTDLLKQATYSTSDATFNQALQQGLPSNATSVSDYTTAIQNLKAMADTVDQLGVAVSKFNSDGTVTVGNFTQATGDLKTALDTALDGKTLSTSDLQMQISTITTFVSSTMPDLLKATVSGQQSWVDQMAALRQTYEAAGSQAVAYGLDGTQLNAKFSALYQAGYAQQLTTLDQADAGVQARYLTATGDDQGAALLTFDTSADQQRKALDDSWEAFLGDSYKSQQDYINQSADLEKTLAAERLKIQQQYNDQALQGLQSTLSGLESYAKGLATSDASPLSAADQYKVANDNLTTDLTAAQGGSASALSNLQDDFQTFLSASKTFNGSGVQYTTDYQRVVQALQTVGKLDTNTLTASVLKDAVKSSTTTLNDTLNQLVDLAAKQLSETRMGNMKTTTGKAA